MSEELETHFMFAMTRDDLRASIEAVCEAEYLIGATARAIRFLSESIRFGQFTANDPGVADICELVSNALLAAGDTTGDRLLELYNVLRDVERSHYGDQP